MRRSGKSILLLQIMDELKEQGIKDKQIIYLNFEIIGFKDGLMKLNHYYLKGENKYPIELSTNMLGNIIKIENVLKSIPEKAKEEKENIYNLNR